MDYKRAMAPILRTDQRENLLEPALRTIALEKEALEALAESLVSTNLGDAFLTALKMINAISGRVIVTGMGKSGLVGRKIAATLASTGTPSFFLHLAEASHGDLGMITKNDVVIALSWSGETLELSDLLTFCARFSVPIIAITSGATSVLGRQATVCLTLPIVPEACPNNLAPTCSTAVQAALGDALAVAALATRHFSPDDFRIFHPRGHLGARLVPIGDLMSCGEKLPKVTEAATIAGATLEMSAKRFGITAIIDEKDRLIGSFTDGDLRRSLSAGTLDDPVDHHMNRQPMFVHASMLASEALAVMNDRNISQLFICAEDRRLVGIVHVHDVLRARAA